MHQLNTTFILGYHGCDEAVGEQLLSGAAFRVSNNDYDWLGPGIYFWESNPDRALDFAIELKKMKRLKTPFIVGAIIDLRLCLDLTTKASLDDLKIAYQDLKADLDLVEAHPPVNGPEPWRRNLDCAVIKRLHTLRDRAGEPRVDTIKGPFIEGEPVYTGAGFRDKTHIQIAVQTPSCIHGVFRVPYPAVGLTAKKRASGFRRLSHISR